jgi:hypothetical protein
MDALRAVLNVDKFSHVKSLGLDEQWDTGIDVLRASAPYLERLKVRCHDPSFTFAIPSSLRTAATPMHLDIELFVGSMSKMGLGRSDPLSLPVAVQRVTPHLDLSVRDTIGLIFNGNRKTSPPILDLLENLCPGLVSWKWVGVSLIELPVWRFPRLLSVFESCIVSGPKDIQVLIAACPNLKLRKLAVQMWRLGVNDLLVILARCQNLDGSSSSELRRPS